MALSDFAAFVKTQIPVMRSFLGSNFLRQEDGLTYVAIVRLLTEEDLPALEMEDGVSTKENKSIILDDMDPTTPLAIGDRIIWPATGTAAINTYRICGLPSPITRNNIQTKLIAAAVAQTENF